MRQGRMYFFVGVLMFILQASYVRRIPNARQHMAALVGISLIIPGYLFIGIAHQQYIFYAGLALYSIASAIVVPSLTTLISNLSPEHEKGGTMGVFRSIGALARACGPIFGASMFWLCGPTFCYAFGGFLLAIPLIMLRSVERNAELKSKCQ
uniref:Major facilitator superfamily (MFS) profile domain-containing protein n=1 Tax=Acrobeloides nanus TaxID=290746 RepID=A0A914EF23_9BILA